MGFMNKLNNATTGGESGQKEREVRADAASADENSPPKQQQSSGYGGYSSYFKVGKSLINKVSEKVSDQIQHITHKDNDRELSMKEQDIRLLERDLNHLENQIPERKDILAKVRLLIKDNVNLREILEEQTQFVQDPEDSENEELNNLLLAQINEYARDSLSRKRAREDALEGEWLATHLSHKNQPRQSASSSQFGRLTECNLCFTECLAEPKRPSPDWLQRLSASWRL